MKFLIIPLFVLISMSLAGGTWVDTTLVPPSLGFETPVRIYLPDGYDPEGTVNYPVIYWLHSYGSTHFQNSFETLTALDSLISSGQIQPVILVKPNGCCEPYGISYWVNSILYGNYEDYMVIDLITFIDSSFCTIANPEYRSIAGHCIGAHSAMRIALEYTNVFKAVASHATYPDLLVAMPLFIPIVLEESPETEPPYTYDWDNGPYTASLFIMSGAFTPNLAAPDSVDFILDSNGEVIDSLLAIWQLYNTAHIVKGMSLPIGLDIFFDCGTNDEWVGCYESNCGYADTLDVLDIDYEFQSLAGGDHYMNLSRFIEEFLFLGEAMTGIEEGASAPSSVLLEPAFPNPFTSVTAIQFDLPEATHVSLQVYDVSGRLVETLVDEFVPAGMYSEHFDGSGLCSGMYLIRLVAGEHAASRRCIIIRDN